MQNRPEANNPLFAIYQTAEQLCAGIPADTEINEICIIGTIGGYSLEEGARMERAEIFPIAIAILVVFGLTSLWRRYRLA